MAPTPPTYDNVPEYPTVTIVIADNSVLVDGLSIPLTADTPYQVAAARYVAMVVARPLGRAVRCVAEDSFGRTAMLIHPDGHTSDVRAVEEEPNDLVEPNPAEFRSPWTENPLPSAPAPTSPSSATEQMNAALPTSPVDPRLDRLFQLEREPRTPPTPTAAKASPRPVTLAKPLMLAGGLLAGALVLGGLALAFHHDEQTPAAATTAAEASTPRLPSGCVSGTTPEAVAAAAASLASTSTITQAGMTVPAPSGAAAAAAAFMRLRTEAPQAYASILAPDATAAAKAAPASAATPAIDMSRAHWQVVSGNGAAADIALLLPPPTGAPRTMKVSLRLVDGAWRVRDVAASPLTSAQLAAAPTFDAKVCS